MKVLSVSLAETGLAGQKTGHLARIIATITVVYWVLLPSGLLWPLFSPLQNGAYFGTLLLVGILLLTATSITLRPRLAYFPKLSGDFLALAAIFGVFLVVSSLNPINSPAAIYTDYGVKLLAIFGGLSMALITRKMGAIAFSVFIRCFCASLLTYALFWLVKIDDLVEWARGD